MSHPEIPLDNADQIGQEPNETLYTEVIPQHVKEQNDTESLSAIISAIKKSSGKTSLKRSELHKMLCNELYVEGEPSEALVKSVLEKQEKFRKLQEEDFGKGRATFRTTENSHQQRGLLGNIGIMLEDPDVFAKYKVEIKEEQIEQVFKHPSFSIKTGADHENACLDTHVIRCFTQYVIKNQEQSFFKENLEALLQYSKYRHAYDDQIDKMYDEESEQITELNVGLEQEKKEEMEVLKQKIREWEEKGSQDDNEEQKGEPKTMEDFDLEGKQIVSDLVQRFNVEKKKIEDTTNLNRVEYDTKVAASLKTHLACTYCLLTVGPPFKPQLADNSSYNGCMKQIMAMNKIEYASNLIAEALGSDQDGKLIAKDKIEKLTGQRVTPRTKKEIFNLVVEKFMSENTAEKSLGRYSQKTNVKQNLLADLNKKSFIDGVKIESLVVVTNGSTTKSVATTSIQLAQLIVKALMTDASTKRPICLMIQMIMMDMVDEKKKLWVMNGYKGIMDNHYQRVKARRANQQVHVAEIEDYLSEDSP